jgi:hypothetical protein
MMFGQKPDPAVTEARKARRDLDAAARAELEAALSPEQRSRLPGKDGGVKENTRVMGGPGGGTMMIVTREETSHGDDEQGEAAEVEIAPPKCPGPAGRGRITGRPVRPRRCRSSGSAA